MQVWARSLPPDAVPVITACHTKPVGVGWMATSSQVMSGTVARSQVAVRSDVVRSAT